MADLVDELLSTSSALSRGEIPPFQSNECFTAGAFDGLLVKTHGADAFELMETLCSRYPSIEASGDCLAGYFALLTQLARQSATTEMPRGLNAILAHHPDRARDLRAWYRLKR